MADKISAHCIWGVLDGRAHLVHCASAVFPPWANGRHGESGRSRRGTRTLDGECENVNVVEFNNESALMAAIIAQESMARVVLNTTSALSSSRL